MINSKFGEIEKNRGITLIALVVTIIVLLILAGVSISMLTGQNGILNRASEAKEKTKLSQKQEKSDMTSLEDLINESVDGTSAEQVSDKNPGVLEQDASDSNVYIINSIEDLVFFAYDVGNNDNTYEGKTVKLGLSLDFNSSKSYVDAFRTDYGKYGYNGELKTLLTSGEGFLPVGNIIGSEQDVRKNFLGIFDGNKFLIKNCFINQEVRAKKRIAFFGCNMYGETKNLGLVDVDYSLTNYDEEGSIAGIAVVTSDESKISNCFVTGKIKEISKGVGAVNCSGIITYNNGIIENCYNLAKIQVEVHDEDAGWYIGGIAVNNQDSYISKCYNKGEIVAKGNAKIAEIGGIARISSAKDNEIINSNNHGNITVEINAQKIKIGGILGAGSNYCVTSIENAYNSGKITMKCRSEVMERLHIGGIIGSSYAALNNELNIKNVYNIGAFDVNGTSDLDSIGAICGEDTSATTIDNSYFLNTIPYSSIGKENSSGDNIDIKSMASNQKQELLTNLNKDGNNSWKSDDKNINNGYPILSWQ